MHPVRPGRILPAAGHVDRRSSLPDHQGTISRDVAPLRESAVFHRLCHTDEAMLGSTQQRSVAEGSHSAGFGAAEMRVVTETMVYQTISPAWHVGWSVLDLFEFYGGCSSVG
jgi:hypothetical protein